MVLNCDCCNHTGKTCEKPPSSVKNGEVLFSDKKTYFYYKDEVEILCHLGYVIDDHSSSSNSSKKITCNSDGKWDSKFPNCTGNITHVVRS